MRRSYDVVALIFGLMLTCLAAASLWHSLVGPIDWHVVKIVAPLALTAVGVLGLVLSRNRPT